MSNDVSIPSTPAFSLTLTTPIVEIPLIAKELDGASETLIVGFVRRNRTEGNALREILSLSASFHTPYGKSERAKKDTYHKEGMVLLKDFPEFAGCTELPTEKEVILHGIEYVKDTYLRIEGELKKVDTRDYGKEFLTALVEQYLNHPVFYQVIARGIVISWNAMDAESGSLTLEALKNS